MTPPHWEQVTEHALYDALLPLAENMPSDNSDIFADPADDGPVIIAWGVKQLARRLAQELHRNGTAMVTL